ncbi:MAG: hypothetical protein FWC16_13425 [Defluviitaleaceae bacterium]|nr:hypothetical protein [Defluviitaleaceae bacterium]MCL2275921.1 hypothetical protein [Defluviitaleaceae bacterium]
MFQYESIINDLQSSMQGTPSAELRTRIIKNATQGITPSPIRRRMGVYPILLALFIFTLTVTPVSTFAVTRLSWREHIQQTLHAPRIADEGYVTYFYPLVFYFTDEMQEQQRRIAEMTLLADLYPYEWDKQSEQHIIKALGLDLTRARDEIDLALKNAFSKNRVASVRLDDTPLLLSPGYFFRDDPAPWNAMDIQGILIAGTYVKIVSGVESLSFLPIPLNTDVAIRAWHIVEVLDGEYIGRIGWMPNFFLKPSDYAIYHFDFDPTLGLLDIFHSARGINFTIRKSFRGSAVMQTEFMLAEDIAIHIADAIYAQFNFCIDGMSGYLMLETRYNQHGEFAAEWTAAILCEERTAHSMANELFSMTIHPVTGAVSRLAMNTPETPFFG